MEPRPCGAPTDVKFEAEAGHRKVCIVPFKADVLRVFIASPGDLADDRDEVEDAIHEWNRQHASHQQVVLLPQRWEGAAARQGGDGQQQINEQQVRESDVVLAMFHTKLGQPTERSVSGTAEEIELGEQYGKPTHVLVSQRTIDLSRVDQDEYGRLKSYLAEIRKRGLTKNFSDSSELRREVNNALWIAVTEHMNGKDGSTSGEAPTGSPQPSVSLSSSVPRYATSLGALVAAVPGYPSDSSDLDPTIRALTAFANVLARVTEPARRVLAQLVRHGGKTSWGNWGMSARELTRRLPFDLSVIDDLVRELERFGLAHYEIDEAPTHVVLQREPANLDWEFWTELREFDNSASGAINEVVVGLGFDMLDGSVHPGEPSDALSTDSDLPNIQWSLTRGGKNTFVLRNVGSDVAEGVTVLPQSAAEISRNLPDGATIQPNASVEFLMIPAWGAPVPNEIQVASAGFVKDPQIVPVPAR